jgi:hypothetical protein
VREREREIEYKTREDDSLSGDKAWHLITIHHMTCLTWQSDLSFSHNMQSAFQVIGRLKQLAGELGLQR